MQLLSLNGLSNVYVFGDIHGEFSSFFHFLKQNTYNRENGLTHENQEVADEFKSNNPNASHLIDGFFTSSNHRIRKKRNFNNSLIIIAGDCGIGFHKFKFYQDLFNKIHQFLIDNNIVICMVRGNHDDPSYFENDLFNLSNIKLIQDYTVIQTCGKNILCVGGGISIDRVWRKQREHVINKHKPKSSHKKMYWENEGVVYDFDKMEEIVNSELKIHYVVSHSSPSFAFPYTKEGLAYWMKIDKDLSKDVDIERQNLTKIYEHLQLSNNKLEGWVYGHFHKMWHEIIDNVHFDCLNCELNCRELIRYANESK